MWPLWVRFPLGEINYFYFPALWWQEPWWKCGIDNNRSTHNVLKLYVAWNIEWLTLGSFCLPCCMRNKDFLHYYFFSHRSRSSSRVSKGKKLQRQCRVEGEKLRRVASPRWRAAHEDALLRKVAAVPAIICMEIPFKLCMICFEWKWHK